MNILLVFLGMVAGWFMCVAEQHGREQIYDWRRPGLVAAISLAAIAAILIRDHLA